MEYVVSPCHSPRAIVPRDSGELGSRVWRGMQTHGSVAGLEDVRPRGGETSGNQGGARGPENDMVGGGTGSPTGVRVGQNREVVASYWVSRSTR